MEDDMKIGNAPTAAAIEEWLVTRLAGELEIDPKAIDVRANMSRLGLDSALAVSLSVDLGAHLGMKLAPTLVWDFPTVESLAGHVAELASAQSR
jgi:acyl carrier protein